ncbi:predicted protein [Naegleria gruberi]|uniref:Predicted protein n=1 Tax=Naegleria gruberi TaxID=5762 RepID=D2VJ54_NAEGR|nr:uncharacterized protein NAEGRDRAFT_68912 [Naegleria gruberi]EFC43221.1 predicted protein [Naegleria gruberi]|eukprot:XP_002675965.1 predicted protein [Naegleria gruberi strain NEG-M]
MSFHHQPHADVITSLSYNIFETLSNDSITINNNNTYNKYNDSAVCHPLLLALGNRSEKGLCDDMTSSTVISAIVLFLHTMLVLVSVGGLVYKLRKLHVLKKKQKQVVNYLQVARNPLLMVIGALIGWSYTFMLMGRVLIGRKVYPCFIFSLIYFIAIPALSNTIIMRCIRLLILTKLNELKVRIGRRQYYLHATTSSDNMKSMIEENTNISQNQVEKELETVTSLDSLSISNSSLAGNQNSTNLSALTVGRTSGILSQFVIEPKDSNADDDENNVEEEMIFRKETLLESFERGKLLSIMRFLVSSKFVLLSYVVVIGFHLSIYFIIAIIDYFNYQNDTSVKTNQKRNSFTIDSYLFSPSGCGVGAYNQYIFISYFCFYGLIGILLSIIAFFAKRDVWNIKIEVVIINLFWAAIVLAFSIPSLFTIITT